MWGGGWCQAAEATVSQLESRPPRPITSQQNPIEAEPRRRGREEQLSLSPGWPPSCEQPSIDSIETQPRTKAPAGKELLTSAVRSLLIYAGLC